MLLAEKISHISLRSKVLKNRADDEYYAPMIFQLTHEKIITFEHYLVSIKLPRKF